VLVDNMRFQDLAGLIKGKTLLKLDIEGQEYGLLRTKHKELIKRFDYIILESHYVSKNLNYKYINKFLKDNNLIFKSAGRFYFINNS